MAALLLTGLLVARGACAWACGGWVPAGRERMVL
jgi:hypothetical protein